VDDRFDYGEEWLITLGQLAPARRRNAHHLHEERKPA
jgi:hypothetical protein